MAASDTWPSQQKRWTVKVAHGWTPTPALRGDRCKPGSAAEAQPSSGRGRDGQPNRNLRQMRQALQANNKGGVNGPKACCRPHAGGIGSRLE